MQPCLVVLCNRCHEMRGCLLVCSPSLESGARLCCDSLPLTNLNLNHHFFMRATYSVKLGPTLPRQPRSQGFTGCPAVGSLGWRPWPVGDVSASCRTRTEACWLGSWACARGFRPAHSKLTGPSIHVCRRTPVTRAQRQMMIQRGVELGVSLPEAADDQLTTAPLRCGT